MRYNIRYYEQYWQWGGALQNLLHWRVRKAKRQVKNNYMCKCCDIKYCDECLKPKIRLSICFKSFPIEVLDTIGSFMRCSDCIRMLKVIEEETPDQ